MTAKVMRMPHAPAFAGIKLEYSEFLSDVQQEDFDSHVQSLPWAQASIKAVVADSASQSYARASSRSLAGPAGTSPGPQSPTEEFSSKESTVAEDKDAQSPTDEVPSQENKVAEDDDDVDVLANRLDRTGIETAAPNVSRNVEVPKGFQLGMAFDIANYYHLRADFRRLDKRKRDLGVLPQSTSCQKHGFRPEELLWYGAIDLKDCKGSNLSNEIHPLLRQDLFDDTPDHVYDQLIPGLRLATFFLSHPACMQFWITLAKGERRVDHEMSRRCGKTRHRISRNLPMTEENVTEVIQYMEKLGEAQAVHFTFIPGLAFEGDAAFGTARTVCDFQSEDSARHMQRSNIRLHSDFYIIAKKLSTMVYPDPAQKLRFNFIFATLIVHELAHAIELSQWRNRAPSPYEPFLLHHNEAELGRMWESYMFGGQVAPINDRVDGIYGVATWNWPRSFGEMDPERTICHAVPMRYLEDIQQMKTWERDNALDDWRAFHIPRDGATSVYMNSVTTVSWSEEERAAKEALQEQQLQDLEEPARKKRETADGHAVAVKNSVLAADEPEAVDAQVALRDQGTTARHMDRVKREPRSVLSKRQRRARRKMEQKRVLLEPRVGQKVQVQGKAEEEEDTRTAKDSVGVEPQTSNEPTASRETAAANNDPETAKDGD
ncbi:MAG: hypothetical protein Q9173_003609 [Seirophora scorigena]